MRLSELCSRLSPSTNASPLGIVIGVLRLQIVSSDAHDESLLTYVSGMSLPFRTTWLLTIATRSPPTATTRLMKLLAEGCEVGTEHAWSAGCDAPHGLARLVLSAPAGG